MGRRLAAAQELVPGTAVSVEIVLEQHTGWVVPRDAVLHDSKGDYIFQVTGSKAERVPARPACRSRHRTWPLARSRNRRPGKAMAALSRTGHRSALSLRSRPCNLGSASGLPLGGANQSAPTITERR